MDSNEATLLGILYTDGCLSPKGKNGWRFYLGNTSWQIIEAFKESLIGLFGLPGKRIRISQKLVNGKPYYKAVIDDMQTGRLLTGKYGTFKTLGNSSASLPDRLQDYSTICQFLKVAFSCDGGVNLYVARNRYQWLIRNVYLACKHPVLRKQYCKLLKKIGITGKNLIQDNLIRIQGKKDLESFANRVGFMQGVRITQHSAYWEGFEKEKVLQLLIASYGNPKAIYNLPQFRVKI